MVSTHSIYYFKRIFISIISLTVIITLLISGTSLAVAQDNLTPTSIEIQSETETPISSENPFDNVTPTITDTSSIDTPKPEETPEIDPTIEPSLLEQTTIEITASSESTIEPSNEDYLESTIEATNTPEVINDNLPNIQPVSPEGWDAPIVISSQQGTHVTDTLTNGEDEYLDIAVYNSGADINSSFTVCLSIDREQIQCWDVEGLAAETYFTVEDWLFTTPHSSASHKLQLVVDIDDAIVESDETDNSGMYEFTWQAPDMETLYKIAPLVNDAYTRPVLPETTEQSVDGSNLPGYFDTSTFMIGEIEVAVIPVEMKNSTESYTNPETFVIGREIRDGISEWVSRSTSTGDFLNKDAVAANLSFSNYYPGTRKVSINPIDLSTSLEDECKWISEVLNNLEYENSNGCLYQIYDLLAFLRKFYHKDWATVVFVVNSHGDADGKFSDGNYAHAYTNGPFIVMTYDNGDWGIENMDIVFQHELAHLFGAADNHFDEENGGCTSTIEEFGYLGIPNSNCEYENQDADTDVLMNDYNTERNHWTAQYQIGWKDSDGDTIPDVIDTQPKFTISNINEFQVLTGVIYDEAYPHASSYDHDVTINTISSAQYRIDDGIWKSLSPVDGTFNSDQEIITLNLDYLQNGTYSMDVQATNSIGNTYTTNTSFTIQTNIPANDMIPNARIMNIDTSYKQFTKYNIISEDEPINVCNRNDTGSVWYQFTAPTKGIFKLNSYGSNYSPNLTILQQDTTTPTFSPIVCSETNTDAEETSQLSFYAKDGITYLIGVSGNTDSWNLFLEINQVTCPTDALCAAPINGDGSIIHEPAIKIINSNGKSIGYDYGEYSGYISAYLDSGDSGSYKVVTSGSGSLIVSNNVKIPGYFAPSAVGLPKTEIIVKDTSGSETAMDSIAVILDSNTNIGGFLDGTSIGKPLALYVSAGTYNLFAANDETGLEIYQPEFTIVSSTNPGYITLDASKLVFDTFSLDLDDITNGTIWIYGPDYYAQDITVDEDREITFAAPLGTYIPNIEFEFVRGDPYFREYFYDLYLLIDGNHSTTIQGGNENTFQIGGTIDAEPIIPNSPIRKDERYVTIYPGVVDDYNNQIFNITGISYYVSSVSTENTESLNQFLKDRVINEDENGKTVTRNIDKINDISTQVYIGHVYPHYQVYFPGTIFYGEITINSLEEPLVFLMPNSAPTGKWYVRELLSLDYSGVSKNYGSFFQVYSTRDYPLANNSFYNAVTIPKLLNSPYAISDVDTRGCTTSESDPFIPELKSKGYASVWYKYIADHDGILTIDTFDSDYDTVLSVWQGTPGSFKNRGFNDDYIDIETTIRYQTSIMNVEVKKKQIYYIEVTQYASKEDENIYVQSTDVNGKSTGDINTQQIGGTLNLHFSLIPCYSLTTKANVSTYGTVKVSPSGNCLTSEYTPGTEITLAPVSFNKYRFRDWSDENSTTDISFTFEIQENTVMMANFEYIPAPLPVSLKSGAIINDNTPSFEWNAVTNGSTYEIQIDNASTFTTPIEMTEIIPDLTFTPSTDLSEKRITGVYAQSPPEVKLVPGQEFVPLLSMSLLPKSPGLKTPSNGVTVRGTPKYTWSVPTSAKAYIFEYDDDENFESPVFTSPELKTYTYRPPLQDPGTYYWHVKVRDVAGNWSAWSTSRSITILPVIPVAPALSSPASGGWVNSSQPTFTWKSVPYGDTYQIQISKVYTFKTTEVDVNGISELSFTCLSDLADGTYYWRVRAINITPENGKWSAYRIVKIDTVAQAVPVLKSPTDASTVLTNRPTLSVNALVSGAKYIEFQVSASDDFTIPLVDTKVTASTFKVPALPYGTYYWHARSVDAAGNESEWTETRSYHTTILKTPADLSSTTDTTPKFTWAAVSGAKRYRIQVSTTSDFSTYDQYEVSYSVLSYSPSKVLSIGTDYYWRMQVKTSSGWASYWTPYYTFTIN